MKGSGIAASKTVTEHIVNSMEVASLQQSIKQHNLFWLFLIAFMLLSFTASYAIAQLQYSRTNNRLEQLKAEKLRLTNEIVALGERLEYVRTDEYVERVARDELEMIMPGEIRYEAS